MVELLREEVPSVDMLRAELEVLGGVCVGVGVCTIVLCVVSLAESMATSTDFVELESEWGNWGLIGMGECGGVSGCIELSR